MTNSNRFSTNITTVVTPTETSQEDQLEDNLENTSEHKLEHNLNSVTTQDETISSTQLHSTSCHTDHSSSYDPVNMSTTATSSTISQPTNNAGFLHFSSPILFGLKPSFNGVGGFGNMVVDNNLSQIQIQLDHDELSHDQLDHNGLANDNLTHDELNHHESVHNQDRDSHLDVDHESNVESINDSAVTSINTQDQDISIENTPQVEPELDSILYNIMDHKEQSVEPDPKDDLTEEVLEKSSVYLQEELQETPKDLPEASLESLSSLIPSDISDLATTDSNTTTNTIHNNTEVNEPNLNPVIIDSEVRSDLTTDTANTTNTTNTANTDTNKTPASTTADQVTINIKYQSFKPFSMHNSQSNFMYNFKTTTVNDLVEPEPEPEPDFNAQVYSSIESDKRPDYLSSDVSDQELDNIITDSTNITSTNTINSNHKSIDNNLNINLHNNITNTIVSTFVSNIVTDSNFDNSNFDESNLNTQASVTTNKVIHTDTGFSNEQLHSSLELDQEQSKEQSQTQDQEQTQDNNQDLDIIANAIDTAIDYDRSIADSSSNSIDLDLDIIDLNNDHLVSTNDLDLNNELDSELESNSISNLISTSNSQLEPVIISTDLGTNQSLTTKVSSKDSAVDSTEDSAKPYITDSITDARDKIATIVTTANQDLINYSLDPILTELEHGSNLDLVYENLATNSDITDLTPEVNVDQLAELDPTVDTVDLTSSTSNLETVVEVVKSETLDKITTKQDIVNADVLSKSEETIALSNISAVNQESEEVVLEPTTELHNRTDLTNITINAEVSSSVSPTKFTELTTNYTFDDTFISDIDSTSNQDHNQDHTTEYTDLLDNKVIRDLNNLDLDNLDLDNQDLDQQDKTHPAIDTIAGNESYLDDSDLDSSLTTDLIGVIDSASTNSTSTIDTIEDLTDDADPLDYSSFNDDKLKPEQLANLFQFVKNYKNKSKVAESQSELNSTNTATNSTIINPIPAVTNTPDSTINNITTKVELDDQLNALVDKNKLSSDDKVSSVNPVNESSLSSNPEFTHDSVSTNDALTLVNDQSFTQDTDNATNILDSRLTLESRPTLDHEHTLDPNPAIASQHSQDPKYNLDQTHKQSPNLASKSIPGLELSVINEDDVNEFVFIDDFGANATHLDRTISTLQIKAQQQQAKSNVNSDYHKLVNTLDNSFSDSMSQASLDTNSKADVDPITITSTMVISSKSSHHKPKSYEDLPVFGDHVVVEDDGNDLDLSFFDLEDPNLYQDPFTKEQRVHRPGSIFNYSQTQQQQFKDHSQAQAQSVEPIQSVEPSVSSTQLTEQATPNSSLSAELNWEELVGSPDQAMTSSKLDQTLSNLGTQVNTIAKTQHRSDQTDPKNLTKVLEFTEDASDLVANEQDTNLDAKLDSNLNSNLDTNHQFNLVHESQSSVEAQPTVNKSTELTPERFTGFTNKLKAQHLASHSTDSVEIVESTDFMSTSEQAASHNDAIADYDTDLEQDTLVDLSKVASGSSTQEVDPTDDLADLFGSANLGTFSLENLLNGNDEETSLPSTDILVPSQLFNDDFVQLNNYVRYLRTILDRLDPKAQILERSKIPGYHRYQIELSPRLDSQKFIRDFKREVHNNKLQASFINGTLYIDRKIDQQVQLIDLISTTQKLNCDHSHQSSYVVGFDQQNQPLAIKLEKHNIFINGGNAVFSVKSKFLTEILFNLAFNNSPDEIEFLAYVDEANHPLNRMDSLPHFIHPICQKQEAFEFLNLVIAEVVRRRQLCGQVGASDYVHYNQFIQFHSDTEAYKPLKPLYVFIDGIGLDLLNNLSTTTKERFTFLTLVYFIQQSKNFGINFVMVNNSKELQGLQDLKIVQHVFDFFSSQDLYTSRLKANEFIYNRQPKVYNLSSLENTELANLSDFWKNAIFNQEVENNFRDYDLSVLCSHEFYQFVVLDQMIYANDLRGKSLVEYLNFNLNSDFYRNICKNLLADKILGKRGDKLFVNIPYSSYLRSNWAKCKCY